MNECIVNKCDGSGLIESKNGYIECQCKLIENAFKVYKKSGAHKDNMIFTNDLSKSPIIKNFKKEEIEMKELIYKLLENGNLDKLVNNNWFLYLVGKVGTGKTQLASTISLEAAYFRNYKTVFIDERSLEHTVFHPAKKNDLLDRIETADILIIDDVGVSGKLSHNENLVQTIVNFLDYIVRKHQGLIIFTSNIKPENLTTAYGKTQTQQLVSVITKGKSRTYFFASENIRENEVSAENDLN
jgi:DNA replication protein DnaC